MILDREFEQLNLIKTKEAFKNWIINSKYNYAVTLTFNLEKTKLFMSNQSKLSYCKSKIKHFAACLDKELYGNSWNKRPSKKRINGILFPSKIDVNIHYHGFIKTDIGNLSRLPDIAKYYWNRYVIAGEICIESLNSSYDSSDWCDYSFAYFNAYKERDINEHVILAYFHNN